MDGGEGDKQSAEKAPQALQSNNRLSSWGGALASAISAFVVSTGILGTLFQQLQWSYQNSVKTRDQDAAKLLEVEKTLSSLIEQRYFTTRRIVDKLKTGVKSEEFAAEERDFSEGERNWSDGEPKLRAEIEYYVDVPSEKSTGNKRAAIHEKNPECTFYAFPTGLNLDPTSASDVLQVSAHCQELIAADIRKAIEARKSGRAGVVEWSADDVRLDHLWWINDVLRCIVAQRAIVVRNSSPDWFSWSIGRTDRRGKRNCLQDYCVYAKQCEPAQNISDK